MRKKKDNINPVRKKLKEWVFEKRLSGINIDQIANLLKIRVQTFSGCLNKATISSANRAKLFEKNVITREDEAAYMEWCLKNKYRYSPMVVY